jgi:hypothetical protein
MILMHVVGAGDLMILMPACKGGWWALSCARGNHQCALARAWLDLSQRAMVMVARRHVDVDAPGDQADRRSLWCVVRETIRKR